MSDSCRCFDVRARVVMDEPKLSGKLDFSGEIITCSDGEDYKRGYDEGHAKGLADGQKVGYENGYNEGQIDGHKSGYEAGKTEGLTEGYDNGYEKGKQDGYADGYEQGYSEGYTKGYENGKAENYDTFWNAYQQNGTRDNYAYAFYGRGWTDENFKPKYDVGGASNCNAMFSGAYITDLVKILEEQGVVLDTSKLTNCTSFFAYCPNITRIPPLDFSNIERTCTQLFRDCKKLESVEINNVPKLEYHSSYNIWNMSFNTCNALKDIKITGVISANFSVAHSPLLTMESVNNIIDCLLDYTGTTTSPVLTLHADVKAKLTEEQIATITGKNWTLA